MVDARTTNTTKRRSVPEISLKASNKTRGFYFMSLYTRKRMHSYISDELPIGHKVIRRVEELATDKNHPTIENRYPILNGRRGMK